MKLKLDIPAEIKLGDTEESGMIYGYASTFGNIDAGGDIVEKGAFARSIEKSIQEGRLIAMLDHHDMRAPVGRWNTFKETDDGLVVEGKLTMGVQRARELHSLAKDKALGGLSIGFRTVSDRYDSKRGARVIEELDLFEVSLVSIPMNSKAVITAVKSQEDITTRVDFEKALRDVLGFSHGAAKSIASNGFADYARNEQFANEDYARNEQSDPSPEDLRKAADGFDALIKRLA